MELWLFPIEFRKSKNCKVDYRVQLFPLIVWGATGSRRHDCVDLWIFLVYFWDVRWVFCLCVCLCICMLGMCLCALYQCGVCVYLCVRVCTYVWMYVDMNVYIQTSVSVLPRLFGYPLINRILDLHTAVFITVDSYGEDRVFTERNSWAFPRNINMSCLPCRVLRKFKRNLRKKISK